MCIRNWLMLLLIAGICSPAFAVDDLIKGDRFSIRVGTYSIVNNETSIALESGNLLGVSLSTTRDLGMDDRIRTPFVDGYFRFNPYHSLHYAWYRNSREGETIVDEEFEWGGETYPLNANLQSELTTNIYKLSYLFSFHHEKKVELGLLAGLHITGVKVAVKGTLQGDVVADEGTDFTAPLPVVGFRMSYDIIPNKLIWWNKVELFYINYDNYEGSLSDISTNIEWRFSKFVGIGAAMKGTRLNLEAQEDNKLASLENVDSGFTAYLSFYF